MPRTPKMTTARLGLHHIRWLRDLAEQEGSEDLVATCDAARAGSGVRHRDALEARRIVVDEINRRSGYRTPKRAAKSSAQLEREIEDVLAPGTASRRAPSAAVARDRAPILLRVTASELVRGAHGRDVAYFNVGNYYGTTTPLRRIRGDEILRVEGTSSGAKVTDEVGGWVADRLGDLGARQVARLMSFLESRRSTAAAD